MTSIRLGQIFEDHLTYPMLVRRSGGGHDIVELDGYIINGKQDMLDPGFPHSPKQHPLDWLNPPLPQTLPPVPQPRVVAESFSPMMGMGDPKVPHVPTVSSAYEFELALSATLSRQVVEDMIKKVVEEQTQRKVARVDLLIRTAEVDWAAWAGSSQFEGARVTFASTTQADLSA